MMMLILKNMSLVTVGWVFLVLGGLPVRAEQLPDEESHEEFRRSGYERTVFGGTRDYSENKEEARAHCKKQLPKLAEQADRDLMALRFCELLWVFDPTGYLGEPSPDKKKWLREVRKGLPALRLTPEAAAAVIEKLKVASPASIFD